MEIADRYIDLGGLRFHYREVGDPSAPPVVLLHGLGPGCGDWDEVALALGDRWRPLAFELRGSYESARADEYSFELMRDDVRAFADALGLERFTLVGHSLGGSVAYLFAEAWPERVDRLVIEDTPPPWPANRPIPPEPPDLPFDYRMGVAIMRQLNDPDPAWWDDLGSLSMPALLVGGGPDSHVPQDKLAEVAARIPDCRLVTLGGGHGVHRERGDEFVAALRSFLGDDGDRRVG